jgi:hypothetical protein
VRDEQRVAGRSREHGVDFVLGRRAAQEIAEQHADAGLVESFERDRLARAADVELRRVELVVAIRRDDQHRHRRQMARDGAQELERVLVGPVEVFEHEHLGVLLRGLAERIDHRREPADTAACGIRRVGSRVEVAVVDAAGDGRARVAVGTAQCIGPDRERHE